MPVPHLTSTPLLLGNRKSLFGIRTARDDGRAEYGIIILNAGLLHNVGPFRMHVDLARETAALGFPALRIDQSGKGESPPRDAGSRTEALFQDYEDAFESLAAHGVRWTVLVGLCSGADDAMQIADRYSTVAGLVLLDGYAHKNAGYRRRNLAHRFGSLQGIARGVMRKVRSLSRKDNPDDAVAIDIRAWASDREMIDMMCRLLDSDRRILAIFTAGQDYYNAEGQLADSLEGSDNRANLREIYFEQTDHTYSRVAHRVMLLDAVRDWLSTHFTAS